MKAFPRAWSRWVESVPTVIMRRFLISYTDTVWWAGNSHHLTVRSRFSAEVKGWLVRKTEVPQGLPPSQEWSRGVGQHGRILQCHCPCAVTPAPAGTVSFPPLSIQDLPWALNPFKNKQGHLPDNSLAILVIDVSAVRSCLLGSRLKGFIPKHHVDWAFSCVPPSWRRFLLGSACLQHNLVHFAQSYEERMQSWYKCKLVGPQHGLGNSWS